MTSTIQGANTIAGGPAVTAAAVTLSPAIRGQTTVQAALQAAIPELLFEASVFATTSPPPGDVYVDDERLYEGGLYQIIGVTIIDATNNNTQVLVGFELDGVPAPNEWVDTPQGGTLSVPVTTPIVLTPGLHTFTIRLARASGTGSSRALTSTLWVTKIGPLP